MLAAVLKVPPVRSWQEFVFAAPLVSIPQSVGEYVGPVVSGGLGLGSVGGSSRVASRVRHAQCSVGSGSCTRWAGASCRTRGFRAGESISVVILRNFS